MFVMLHKSFLSQLTVLVSNIIKDVSLCVSKTNQQNTTQMLAMAVKMQL